MIRDNFGHIPLNLRDIESRHKQVEVTSPTDEPIFVDEGLRLLLPALWKRNIETLYSCQGDDETLGYIYFTSDEDQYEFHLLMAGSGVHYDSDPVGPAAICRFKAEDLSRMTEFVSRD